ncbi:MAG: CotS family spore coat protein [Clostridiales bacterium]|jgi:spore coat protein I|nr:CotS family spore coat protein [Clostridiales bacterium]
MNPNIDVHDIEMNYGFKIDKLSPYRDGYLLETSIGTALLRAPKISQERIEFINNALTHLSKNKFSCTDQYIQSLNNKPYITLNDIVYVCVPHRSGRDCNFENTRDLAGASHLLAAMHKASQGFTSETAGPNVRSELGGLPQLFRRRLDELKRFRKMAKRSSGKFDYAFLSVADEYCQLGETVLFELGCSPYSTLVEKARKEGCLCHCDFTGHNILINHNDSYLLNFENCTIDLPIYDIANFLRRRMRKCNWDFTEAKYLLDNYNAIRPISKAEMEVLRLMIQFPQKLWRIVNKYYNSKRSWCEKNCLDKLTEVIDEKDPLELFAENMDLL